MADTSTNHPRRALAVNFAELRSWMGNPERTDTAIPTTPPGALPALRRDPAALEPQLAAPRLPVLQPPPAPARPRADRHPD